MSVLVRANVSIGGLAAGEVGEIPDGLYESARKRGYVEAVDRLESRLKAVEPDASGLSQHSPPALPPFMPDWMPDLPVVPPR